MITYSCAMKCPMVGSMLGILFKNIKFYSDSACKTPITIYFVEAKKPVIEKTNTRK
jgi:hypothetical protein